jgi:hypothetical protein
MKTIAIAERRTRNVAVQYADWVRIGVAGMR